MNKEQIKTLINSGETYDDNDLELSEYRNHALLKPDVTIKKSTIMRVINQRF